MASKADRERQKAEEFIEAQYATVPSTSPYVSWTERIAPLLHEQGGHEGEWSHDSLCNCRLLAATIIELTGDRCPHEKVEDDLCAKCGTTVLGR